MKLIVMSLAEISRATWRPEVWWENCAL